MCIKVFVERAKRKGIIVSRVISGKGSVKKSELYQSRLFFFKKISSIWIKYAKILIFKNSG